MALAALMDDPVAVVLTAVAAVVVTGAVVVYVRESDLDKERIAHLQAAIPHVTAPLDADAAVHLAPKPSAVVGEVLRQQKPGVSLGAATPISIPPVAPIDQS